MGKHNSKRALRERKYAQPRYPRKNPATAAVTPPAPAAPPAALVLRPERPTAPAPRIWNPATLVGVQQRLGYRFTDQELLKTALTHSSAGIPHNERLEFLGDAVLGVVVAYWLYQHHPRWAPGALTETRSHLVNTEALAGYARAWELPYALLCSLSADEQGVRSNVHIAANTLEALIAAIWIDSGYNWESVLGVLQELLKRRLAKRRQANP